MKAFSVAMPKIDMSAFEVMQGFSTEALGLIKAMESVTAPMHDALSSVAFDQLEAVRRDAARSMKAFEGALP